jgi:nicotinamidase-related amidase
LAVASQDPLRHAPDQAHTALLLIDVINDLEFDGGEQLLAHAMPMARQIAALKRQAHALGIPAIYTNDNFGRWRSDLRRLVAYCTEDDVRGKPIVDLLKPEDDDYFILKPRHSAFYQTNLDILLKYLGAKTLILSGVASDICVLFTANDAYMREFELYVPADCVAAEDPEHNQQALAIMQRVLKADIRRSTDLELDKLACEPKEHS